jgi:heme-degrading monooxygenase HmoA
MSYNKASFPLPYYAVIFTNEQSSDLEGYAETAAQMEALASEQPGYLGMDHAREELGITISYWKNEASILAWKEVSEHALAQQQGKSRWYSRYTVRVCRVEREYNWDTNKTSV